MPTAGGRHSRMKDEEEAWWKRHSAALRFLQRNEEMNLGLRLAILTFCICNPFSASGLFEPRHIIAFGTSFG